MCMEDDREKKIISKAKDAHHTQFFMIQKNFFETYRLREKTCSIFFFCIKDAVHLFFK